LRSWFTTYCKSEFATKYMVLQSAQQ